MGLFPPKRIYNNNRGGGGASVLHDTQTFAGDGEITEFTIEGDANTSIFAVDVGGNLQTRGVDYTVVDKTVTFTVAPDAGTVVGIHPAKGAIGGAGSETAASVKSKYESLVPDATENEISGGTSEGERRGLSVDNITALVENYVNRGGNIIDSTTSNMDGQGLWLKQLGNPGMTFSGGIMSLTFTSGNQSVKVDDILEVGKEYNVEVRLRVVSGTISKVVTGLFAANSDDYINPSSEWAEYSLTIIAAQPYFAIGMLLADNTGGEIEVDYVKVLDETTTIDTKIYNLIEEYVDNNNKSDNLIYSNTSGIFGSLSKAGKKLLKIATLGDSLLANGIGGSIPAEEDEGVGMRPMRLTKNNVSRRIYDFLSWNKATHRRIGHTDWTQSGSWSTLGNDDDILEPAGDELMYVSSVANEYVEITVPDGMENFAFICKEGTGLATLSITLNGGNISTYGLSSVDTAYVATGHTGNPFKVVEYLGLPPGANVIRITRDSTTNQAILWGGFYWTGVTMIVQNIAHGGHTMKNLSEAHLNDELVRNNFDAVYFEIPELNEMGLDSIELSSTSLETILNTYLNNKDVLISSCNIFGTDPSDGTPNYYETTSDVFTQKELNSAMKRIVVDHQLPFVDLFTLFERKVIGLGGTLEDGDAGQYTTDGQHGNELGVTEWFNMLKPILRNTPIYE